MAIDESFVENVPVSSIPATRYKARIDFVSPQSRRDSFQLEQQCFLGVSLENRNFQPARFHSQLEWISRRFPKCIILVGDSIHRLTLESRSGLPAKEAFRRALQLGNEFVQENRNIVASYRSTTHFEFITCHEIQQTHEYETHHRGLADYFLNSPTFRASVERFGFRYHRNDWDTLTEAEKNDRLRNSSNYFIEELAIFACLVKRGVTLMVYPGSFNTLAEIADHQFPGISKELESLCVVSLDFKGR